MFGKEHYMHEEKAMFVTTSSATTTAATNIASPYFRQLRWAERIEAFSNNVAARLLILTTLLLIVCFGSNLTDPLNAFIPMERSAAICLCIFLCG